MPTCQSCDTKFPNLIKINGKNTNLQRRKFCLKCSPFGSRNTSKYLNKKTDKRKTCSSCAKTFLKNRKNFYYNNKKDELFAAVCIPCRNKQMVERLRAIKQECVSYMGGKCSKCGYKKCNAALDFHHLDPSTKEFNLAQQRSYSLRVLKPELDKCILLCKNCHAEKHNES